MIKPPRLHPGDTVATISLSSGLAATFPHRYEAGKRQLAETFGLRVIETPNALRSDDWLYNHPEARADDLHWALEHPEVKAIISNIGGYESVRILPHLDEALIRQRPKIFMGYSDTTTILTAFFNAGVVSFHGPCILANFAENTGIFPYEAASLRKTLFSAEAPGALEPAPAWTEEFLDWARPELQTQARRRTTNPGWVWLQGEKRAEGQLLGGNIEVLEMLKGTAWWPPFEKWHGAVFYFETSEEVPPPSRVEYWLRNYASQGILTRLSGILIGRPMNYDTEMTQLLYDAVKKVLAEVGREDMPVMANMDFGHTSPMMVLPNGCRAAIDPLQKRVELLEPAVTPS